MSKSIVKCIILSLLAASSVAQAQVVIQNFPGRLIPGNRYVMPVRVFVDGQNKTYDASRGFILAQECQGSNHRKVGATWWVNVGVQRTYWYNQVSGQMEVVFDMPSGTLPVQFQMAFWMRGRTTAWSAVYQAR